MQAYMNYIQANAELAVRNLLHEIGRSTLEKTGQSCVKSEDYLDDGSKICLHVSIDLNTDSAIFDFRYEYTHVLRCIRE